MIKLAIVKGSGAFLPEAYAYYDFFKKYNYGIDAKIYNSVDSITDADVAIVFYGFYPLWKKYDFFIIGEYNSVSIGRFSKIKDFFKTRLNKRDFLFFLNDFVQKELNYKNEDYILRGMGFFNELIVKHKNDYTYDIVYSGTINRYGLKERIIALAKLGFKIAVIGTAEFIHENVSSLGKLPLPEVYKLYATCKYGLNYTPDIYPYKYQDSTKVIEYCAAGLKVITNKYSWINEFELLNKGNFLDLDTINDKNDVANFHFIIPNVEKYSWDNVIRKSGMIDTIKQLNAKKCL
ncbi:hypothetical protein [Photobacterium damselae]|uniref:Glycosyltransferase n=1 Tax=Photobacterium damselae TaxID=38293 RepID=A0ABD6WYR7_PHODM|nr:hypothetical protein [Photobacterium damselae]OBU42742.1 hypothetical protein AYY27_19195 [Photobacterium damselae]PSU14838.1 hypothetical protein CTM90_19340 [Photobacterium damselae]